MAERFLVSDKTWSFVIQVSLKFGMLIFKPAMSVWCSHKLTIVAFCICFYFQALRRSQHICFPIKKMEEI